MLLLPTMFFFFFNDTATTEIYTLSLHDALPIYSRNRPGSGERTGYPARSRCSPRGGFCLRAAACWRSEEHTSELQSRLHLVCRLLLEKKKIIDCQIVTYNTMLAAFISPSYNFDS